MRQPATPAWSTRDDRSANVNARALLRWYKALSPFVQIGGENPGLYGPETKRRDKLRARRLFGRRDEAGQSKFRIGQPHFLDNRRQKRGVLNVYGHSGNEARDRRLRPLADAATAS